MADGVVSSQMSLTGTSPYTAVDSEKDNAGKDGQQKDSVAEKGTTNSKKRKEMAPRSEVWNNFTKIFEGDAVTNATCNHCKREFACLIKRNGTSSLLKHLGTCKSNPDRVKDDKQPTLQATNNPNGASSFIPWRYDAEKLRDTLAEMIIMDELPFAFVEKPGFRSFVAKACPRFGVPSRGIVSAFIGFFLVRGHKGEDIGKDLEKCLVEWGINKVFSITVDNASPNDGAVSYIKRIMNNAKASIGKGEYMHMRCAAHIVNLIVTDGLKELDISVKRVRTAVKFIRNSPARITKFKKCAELEKLEGKGFLSLDVCTRWNSTYLMLKAAAMYEKVFVRYEEEDPYFAIELNAEKMPGVPEPEDWDNASKMTVLVVYC